MLSYFHEINPNASYNFIFAVDVILVFSIWFGYQLGTYLLNKRVNVKLIIVFGGSCCLVGVYLASYTRDIVSFLIFYCVFNGLGTGCCYFIPLVCGWEYFPHKKGMVSGTILAGYGFAAFIFNLVSSKLVNPTGANPTVTVPGSDITFFDSSVSDRVPIMLRTLVFIWVWLILAALALITRPPEE